MILVSSGHNNWIQINYGDNGAVCTLDLTQAHELNKTAAIDFTISKITERYQNLYVSLSGGIDSEFAAQCLFERGIPFTPISVDFEFNAIEQWYARYWCYQRGLKLEVIKLSRDFLINALPSMVSKNIGSTFLSAITMILLDVIKKNSGKLITGSTEPFHRPHAQVDNMNATSLDLDVNSHDFFDAQEPHPFGFINYTPELFGNIIRELDYTKPVQLAMCEYYGALVRPKLNLRKEIERIPEIEEIRRKTVQFPSYNFFLGNKDEFLQSYRDKQVLKITGTINS